MATVRRDRASSSAEAEAEAMNETALLQDSEDIHNISINLTNEAISPDHANILDNLQKILKTLKLLFVHLVVT